MRTLSIQVSESLAKESANLARVLGISRNEFIREAIAHEITLLRTTQQEKAISKALSAMRDDPEYMQESEEITNDLNTELPTEDDMWWKN